MQQPKTEGFENEMFKFGDRSENEALVETPLEEVVPATTSLKTSATNTTINRNSTTTSSPRTATSIVANHIRIDIGKC